MRALSTSPMASVNLRFDKNFGFSHYGNILHMISGNVILVTCCQNRRKCSIAKLLEIVWFWSGAKICKACRYRKKVRSVAKIELDTADHGPLLKTRRVFLAIFAFVLQRTLRLNRKTSGSAGTKPVLPLISTTRSEGA